MSGWSSRIQRRQRSGRQAGRQAGFFSPTWVSCCEKAKWRRNDQAKDKKVVHTYIHTASTRKRASFTLTVLRTYVRTLLRTYVVRTIERMSVPWSVCYVTRLRTTGIKRRRKKKKKKKKIEKERRWEEKDEDGTKRKRVSTYLREWEGKVPSKTPFLPYVRTYAYVPYLRRLTKDMKENCTCECECEIKRIWPNPVRNLCHAYLT